MLGSWDAFLVRQLCECMRVQYFLKWDDNDTLSYRKICAIRLFCQELVALAKHRGVKANGKKASTDLALGDSVLVGPGEEILYIYIYMVTDRIMEQKERIIFRSCFAVDEFSIIVVSMKGYPITKMSSQSFFRIVSRFRPFLSIIVFFPLIVWFSSNRDGFAPMGIFHNYFSWV